MGEPWLLVRWGCPGGTLGGQGSRWSVLRPGMTPLLNRREDGHVHSPDPYRALRLPPAGGRRTRQESEVAYQGKRGVGLGGVGGHRIRELPLRVPPLRLVVDGRDRGPVAPPVMAGVGRASLRPGGPGAVVPVPGGRGPGRARELSGSARAGATRGHRRAP